MIDLSTVDEKHSLDAFGHQVIEFSSPKFKSRFRITKAHGGNFMWEISVDKGRLHGDLCGRWTTINNARNAVLNYLRKAQPTSRRKAQMTYEENHPPKE